MRVEVETRGTHTTGFTLVSFDTERANAHVAVRIDEHRFLEQFMERICG
jgi:inosine-uridine nucleoside N-ribohydrolase